MPRSILGSIYQAVRLIRFKWTECNLSRTGGMMEYPHIVSWNLPSLWRLYDCQLGVDVFIFYTAVKWERRGWSFQMKKEFWTVKPYMCFEPFQVIIRTCWHRPLGGCWYLLKSFTPWTIPQKIDTDTCDHLMKSTVTCLPEQNFGIVWSPDVGRSSIWSMMTLGGNCFALSQLLFIMQIYSRQRNPQRGAWRRAAGIKHSLRDTF